MIATLRNYPNLRLVEASVEDIKLDEEALESAEKNNEAPQRSARVRGVLTKEGELIEGSRVIITTGTFLRGLQ